jgi:hypothetical protein
VYFIRGINEFYANHVFRIVFPHNPPSGLNPGQRWREFETEIWELVTDQFGIRLQRKSFWADVQKSAAISVLDYDGGKQNPLAPITASVGEVRISLGI